MFILFSDCETGFSSRSKHVSFRCTNDHPIAPLKLWKLASAVYTLDYYLNYYIIKESGGIIIIIKISIFVKRQKVVTSEALAAVGCVC